MDTVYRISPKLYHIIIIIIIKISYRNKSLSD